MKAISNANPNRNGSYFTKEAMEKAIPSFYNKPILGYFNIGEDDFEAHNSDLSYDQELDQLYYDYNYDTAEKPLGLIRQDDKVEIYQEKSDGLYWIKFTCALWVKYNYASIKKLLKSKMGKKKISVEVAVLDYDEDENGIEIIKEFIFDGCSILGDNWETGIKDAEMTIIDMVKNSDFQKKQECLTFAYNALENKRKFVTEENPIENENPKEQIKMDNLKELTYENKKRLAESFLNKDKQDSPYYWGADISDDKIFYNYNGTFYQADYSIDSNNNIFINLDNEERVISSWAVYNGKETEMLDEKEMKKEEEAKIEDNKENDEGGERKKRRRGM